ncbi:hypothetical protein CFIO01_12647 [Colletotrichum fioriniae PJ7]|uniref:Gfo/Idh/MocA-like oxidoreductase N-terminal domain-containing protein n=1 Tax=Colletotrichum fioriniae PJ7 TaxID=1445577 RepID=A0A010R952_9PEZI|nr:hypothetical protein CFIO01_12647 [Colletotrichum fioriniae PJ7]
MAPQVTNVGFIGLSFRPYITSHAFHSRTHQRLTTRTANGPGPVPPTSPTSPTPNNTASQPSKTAPKKEPKKAVRLHNLPQDTKAYGNLDALVSDSDIDPVAITIKVHLHAAAVETAIRAGKSAVFCEWPLARNGIEAEHLASLAKDKGVRILVGLQGR